MSAVDEAREALLYAALLSGADEPWQVVVTHYADALIAAVRAEALDVERLAMALRTVTRGTWSTPTQRTPGRQREQDERWLHETAERIAREYAALGENGADRG